MSGFGHNGLQGELKGLKDIAIEQADFSCNCGIIRDEALFDESGTVEMSVKEVQSRIKQDGPVVGTVDVEAWRLMSN